LPFWCWKTRSERSLSVQIWSFDTHTSTTIVSAPNHDLEKLALTVYHFPSRFLHVQASILQHLFAYPS
jgi:hypothetical protein